MTELNLTEILKNYVENEMPEKEKDCDTKEFKQLMNERYQLLESIESRLDEDGVNELHCLNEVFSEIRFEAEDYMFEKGFRLGAKLIAEILYEKKVK